MKHQQIDLTNVLRRSVETTIQSGTSEETCGFAEEVPQTKSKVLTAQNFSNERHYEGDYHTLNLNFDFEGYEVSSITGTRETKELSNIDWDASHVDFYSATREQTYKQFSQEVTLRKQHNEKLAYSFGFYYLDFDYTLFQEEFHVLRALHNAGLACCFSADDILRTNSKQSGDLQSAFVHGTYQINEQWIADAGLRFSKFDKTLSHQPRGWRYGDIILESKRDFSGHQTTKETTPTLGLSYKVDEEAMIYLRYSTGYLPGAYDENALSLDTAQPTEAQTAESWELGMNSEWLEDKLRLNMTYFQIDYDNKIEEVPLLRSTGQIELFRKNLSNYEVTGYEIEFQYIPMTNLMIRGNYTHMNANYHNFLVDNLDIPEEPFDLRGLDPHRSPRESLYISFEYSKNYFYGTFNAFAGYRLYSDYQTNSRLPVANIFNWTSWDLSLDYVWRDWTIRVFAQNVKDKQHLQNVRTITQADVLAQDVVTNDLAPLITYAEYSQPRYGGIEIIFKPDVKALFKKPNFAALKPTFLSKIPLINKIPLISK